jgi:hypothetical protein
MIFFFESQGVKAGNKQLYQLAYVAFALEQQQRMNGG